MASVGDTVEIQYRYRNSSQKYDLKDVIFKDIIPKGIDIQKIKTEKNAQLSLVSLSVIWEMESRRFWKNNFSCFKKNLGKVKR